MKLRKSLRGIAQVLVCAGLIIAAGFWLVVVIRLATGFASGGVDGARGAIHQIILSGAISGQIDQDPVAALSRGYERLFVWILITWALREVYGLLRRKM